MKQAAVPLAADAGEPQIAQATAKLEALRAKATSEIKPDRVLTPLQYPGKVLCAGANYYDHIAEMGVPDTRKALSIVGTGLEGLGGGLFDDRRARPTRSCRCLAHSSLNRSESA